MTSATAPTLHFEGLFQNSQDPLYVVNAQRRLIFFNHACVTLTGVAAERVLGLECRLHGPHDPADPASLTASLCPPPAALSGQAMSSSALLLHPDGQRLWCVIHFTPIAAADGALAAVLGRIGGPVTEIEEDPTADSLHTALLRLRQRLYGLYRIDQIVAASSPMRRVLQQLRLAAEATVPVFFEGEPGVGKGRLARTLHGISSTANAPFVTLDCATLTTELLEQQLAERGLLTPATGGTRTWGTLHVKEPACLSRELQARLAQFLARLPLTAGVRILASSTRTAAQIAQLTQDGSFHQELLDLLTTLVIAVPPLRERGPDIPLLAQQVVEQCNTAGTKQVTSIQPAALELLQAYPWPGNLAQFEAVLREACAQVAGSELKLHNLPRIIREAADLARLPVVRNERPLSLDELLANAERRLIQLALKDAGGNLSQAATCLGLTRPRLHRRLTTLGLSTDTSPAAEEAPPTP